MSRGRRPWSTICAIRGRGAPRASPIPRTPSAVVIRQTRSVLEVMGPPERPLPAGRGIWTQATSTSLILTDAIVRPRGRGEVSGPAGRRGLHPPLFPGPAEDLLRRLLRRLRGAVQPQPQAPGGVAQLLVQPAPVSVQVRPPPPLPLPHHLQAGGEHDED